MNRRRVVRSIAFVGFVALGVATAAVAQTPNPCAAKNPGAVKSTNPCAAKDPGAAKNPCAAKNPAANRGWSTTRGDAGPFRSGPFAPEDPLKSIQAR